MAHATASQHASRSRNHVPSLIAWPCQSLLKYAYTSAPSSSHSACGRAGLPEPDRRRSGRSTRCSVAGARGSGRRTSRSCGSTDGRRAGRGRTARRRACAARRKTSSCSQLASRTSTAQRMSLGASVRNSSRRSALRFQRGGSCTRFGPRWEPSRSTRSRWLSSQPLSASFSFLRCEPNWPSFSAYVKPGGACFAHPRRRLRRRQAVEAVVDLDGVEMARRSTRTTAMVWSSRG